MVIMNDTTTFVPSEIRQHILGFVTEDSLHESRAASRDIRKMFGVDRSALFEELLELDIDLPSLIAIIRTRQQELRRSPLKRIEPLMACLKKSMPKWSLCSPVPPANQPLDVTERPELCLLDKFSDIPYDVYDEIEAAIVNALPEGLCVIRQVRESVNAFIIRADKDIEVNHAMALITAFRNGMVTLDQNSQPQKKYISRAANEAGYDAFYAN